MFMGFVALLIMLTVPLAGGRLLKLADLQVRGIPLLLAALLAQILITDVATNAPGAVLSAAHIATYVAAAVVIWLNRRLPGLAILGAGAGLNAAVIALNGGTLPASASALRSAGIDTGGDFANSGVVAHPRLGFLGDTMATPAWLPFRNVISVGDIVILLGLFVLVHVMCGSRIGVLLSQFTQRADRSRAIEAHSQPVAAA